MNIQSQNKLSSHSILELFEEKRYYVTVARALVRSTQVAEDIFQESILYLLEHKDRIDDTNPRAYFAMLMRDKCLYHLRQTCSHDRIHEDIRNSRLISESIEILSSGSSDMEAFRADLNKMMASCRERLSEQSYSVFRYHKFNGLSHKEIARKMGITERQVNAEIQKAIKVFREEFKDYQVFVLLLTAGIFS